MRKTFLLFAALWFIMYGVHGTAQTLLYMDIGSFQAAFAPDFYESYEHAAGIYENRYGSSNYISWPAEYIRERESDSQGLLGAFGIYLTLTDFTDKKSEHHDYFHAAVWADRGPYGDRIKKAYTAPRVGTPELRSKRFRKWREPEVRIDNFQNMPENDEIDPALISEMMIENAAHSEMGITITRKAYGWSQQDNDDFIIVEFLLENTGYVMEYNVRNRQWDKAVKPFGWPQSLQNVWFALCYRFQPSALGCQQNGNWGEKLLSGKGHDAQHIYIGETYGQAGQRIEDSLRALIAWDGDADNAAIGYDDTGNPHILTGVLLSPQYVGVSILHADEYAHSKGSDAPDDPSQPKTTRWRGESEDGYAFEQIDWNPSESVVYSYISSGLHQESGEIGGETSGGLDNIVEEHGYFLGFGPYDFEPDQVVRIVAAYAAGGISRHRAIEVGQDWVDLQVTDLEKNEILATGRDSLLMTFSKSKALYEKTTGLTLCPEDILPPPPPESFSVTSEIGQIKLKWNGVNSESVSDFAGYRLYRNYRPVIPLNPPAHPADTLYTKIWQCGEGALHPAVVDSFVDRDVKSLWEYRYYLTAVDKDGNESGRFYTLFPEGITAQPGWLPDTRSPLDNVMVIPNPAINKARQWGRRIMFVNLPETCTIKIYTQSGNLLKVIEHPNADTPSDGDEYWYQDTMDNQYVTSGFYIYTVESELGNTMGNLVIIR